MLVKSTAELECHSNVTCFASTMPLLTSSLLGQVQDMPLWCLHMSTLFDVGTFNTSENTKVDSHTKVIQASIAIV